MKLKYCPICKSKLNILLNYEGEGIDKLFCNENHYNSNYYDKVFHFEMSHKEIVYTTTDFRLTLYKSNNEFHISYFLNGNFKVFAELDENFYIYFDKAFEILENNLGSFRLKMLVKKFDGLLLFK